MAPQVKTQLPLMDSVPHTEFPYEQISPPEEVDVYEAEMVHAYLNGADIFYADDSDSANRASGPLYEHARKSMPRQFPTKKPGHTSKDRRYIPSPKKTDIPQIQSGTGKGARSEKLQKALNNGD